MVDTPYLTTDRTGANVALPTAQAVVDAVTALAPLLDGLEGGLAALLVATNTPSAARPLPAGAASAAKQDLVLAQNAPYGSRVAAAVGATLAVGRALEIVVTAAGNVSLVLADNSTTTIPVNVGLSIIPYGVKQIVSAGTTATATYGVLN